MAPMKAWALVSAVLLFACSSGDPAAEDDDQGVGAGGPGGGASGGGGSGSGAGGTGGTFAPVDLCEGLSLDRDAHPMQPLAKPALLAPYVDPAFGARIVRITAAPAGTTVKPMYSTVQSWNADESLLILYAPGYGHLLFDGQSYEYLRALPIAPPDLEQVYWHHSDPAILLYIELNQLIRYDVIADDKQIVRTLPCSGQVRADSHGFASWDSNTLSLRCVADGNVFFHRIDSGESSGFYALAEGDPPMIAPSGDLAYWGGYVVDADLAVVAQLDVAYVYDHASLGRFADGRDTYNAVAFDPGPAGSGIGTLVSYELATGAWRVIIGPDTGYPYPPGGTHVSAVSRQNPGWVWASIIGTTTGQGVLDGELVVADTSPDGSGHICRVAHHRSFGKDGPQGYWAEPHVSASPSGTRALFGSDWGGSDTVDTYVVELPSFAR